MATFFGFHITSGEIIIAHGQWLGVSLEHVKSLWRSTVEVMKNAAEKGTKHQWWNPSVSWCCAIQGVDAKKYGIPKKTREKKNNKFYTPDTYNLFKDLFLKKKNRNRKMPSLAQQHFCPERKPLLTGAGSGLPEVRRRCLTCEYPKVGPLGVRSSDSNGNNSNILM